MRSPVRLLTLSSLSLLWLVGCGGSPHRELQVMSYMPQGSVDHAGSVEIRFDKPVVDEAMVGKSVAAGTVAITPAIDWSGFWHDRQTLTINPAAPLQPSTRYRVALIGDLASRTAGFSFAFVHQPLAIDGLVGVDGDALVPDAALPLHFNQPVRPADAAAHCQLTAARAAGEDAGGAEARDIALATHDTAPAAIVALRPARPLAPGARYTLHCAGLAGAGGDVALDPPYALAVQARPGLEVTAADPTGKDVSADQVTIALTFSTPVSLDAARKAVSSTPPIDRPRTLDHRLLVERTLAKGDTWSGALGTPSDVLRDGSTLTITVDRTGLGDLAPGLRALVEYPYDCLEQTLSRFIPLVAAKDLARLLDDPGLQGTRANQFIAAGIAEVLRHQQGDGLFSLWPQSQTYPHLAAYALWGLSVAAAAGESVPRRLRSRPPALAAWATSAPVKPDGDAATMAMAVYVMALRVTIASSGSPITWPPAFTS